MADGSQDDFLSQAQRDALVNGAAMFIDEAFEDFVRVCDGEGVKDSLVFAGCLSRQFRHYYTELFLKRFLVAPPAAGSSDASHTQSAI